MLRHMFCPIGTNISRSAASPLNAGDADEKKNNNKATTTTAYI